MLVRSTEVPERNRVIYRSLSVTWSAETGVDAQDFLDKYANEYAVKIIRSQKRVIIYAKNRGPWVGFRNEILGNLRFLLRKSVFIERVSLAPHHCQFKWVWDEERVYLQRLGSNCWVDENLNIVSLGPAQEAIVLQVKKNLWSKLSIARLLEETQEKKGLSEPALTQLIQELEAIPW